jgi:hypothetical protein
MKDETLSIIRRAFVVWLVIALAESVHGTARILFLQPLIGDFPARQLAVFSGILIILAIAYLFSGWLRAKNDLQLFAVGLLWIVLTLTFEISLGRAMNLSWARIFSDYDIADGGLMPIGLAFMLLAPLIAAKLKARRQAAN